MTPSEFPAMMCRPSRNFKKFLFWMSSRTCPSEKAGDPPKSTCDFVAPILENYNFEMPKMGETPIPHPQKTLKP
jgi:hypothetical protein